MLGYEIERSHGKNSHPIQSVGILDFLPESLLPMCIVFALSFLIGLEREEHAASSTYNFGGIRTFPIIGISGYLIARLSLGQPMLIAMGALVLGSLLWLSYRKKLEISSSAGMTSEISGLFTFLLGALVYYHAYWEATAMAIIVLLLLELKTWLEGLARKIPPDEIVTLTRFLLISIVILPIVPNRAFTILHFNPFKTWLIVVAICGISYAGYVLAKMLGSGRSLALATILGGIYSSTITTIVLAKRSREQRPNNMLSGAIVIASGIMYFRLVVLLCLFNWSLGTRLALPLIGLGVFFTAIGGIWMGFWLAKGKVIKTLVVQVRNPLALTTALSFAVLFFVMAAATMLVRDYLGPAGIYSLSFLTGITDVYPFVMSLSQTAGHVLDEHLAAQATIIATASNNLMKGIYAAIWGIDGVRKHASVVLAALAIFSLVALLFV